MILQLLYMIALKFDGLSVGRLGIYNYVRVLAQFVT